MENQNPTAVVNNNNIVRPWQGTFLAVLMIIGLVLLAIFIPMLFLGAGFIATFLPSQFAGLTMAVGFVFIGFFVLGIFMTIGLFKGQKWATLLSMVFSALGVLGAISADFNVLNLLLNAFVLYLGFASFKHPFYNQK